MIINQVWWLLSPTQRRQYIALVALMVVGAALEMLGIGSLLPLLALMTQPDLITQHAALRPWLALIGSPDQIRLIMIAMGAFMLINFLRVGFLGVTAWLQTNFIKRLVVDLSQRLYRGYLAQPYTFHLARNSSQLMRNTTGEVALVAGVAQNTLGLFTELLVTLAIAGLLLAVDPMGVLLVISLLGTAAWWFHRVTDHRIYRWGEQRRLADDVRYQQVLQGLGGVKEIKLLGLEAFVLDEYYPYSQASAHANQRHTFVQALPRLWLELLVILGLGGYVIAVLAQGKPVDLLVPTLGLFGAAAFRLMPSANRILGAVQGIRFGTPAVQNLVTEINAFPAVTLPERLLRRPAWFSQAITLDGVSYTYPTGHKPALHQITLEVPIGTAVGFVGGSGAGKSTLIDLILGLLSPTKGIVRVDGVDIRGRLGDWQGQIGYVPQTIYLTDDSLRRNIAFGLPEAQIDDAAVWRAVRLAQLETFVADLPQGLETCVGERGVRLSGGQRQRIGIARTLYYDPPVLVLDEATSALDNATEEDLMAAVNALHGQKTLLIVAHRLTTVARCDMIYRLEEGRIVESGPPSAVLGTAVSNGHRDDNSMTASDS